jgi:acetyl esterase
MPRSHQHPSARAQSHHRRRATVWKWTRAIGASLILLGVFIYSCFEFSPWPKALLIRDAFDKGAVEISRSLDKHVPSSVDAMLDLQYQPHDPDAYLDLFSPHTLQSPAPVLSTIVWIHGGAWISGRKSHVANYLKILASHGYTTVGVGYSIVPGQQYPTPLKQLDRAIAYLQHQAPRLRVDPHRIVLAGDSAGAQIAAQMAAMTTSPTYADKVGIQPTLQPHQLKAVLLNCGAYDVNGVNYNGSFGAFLKTVLWSYSGTPNFLTEPKFRSFSVINYLTPSFPRSFITAGNADSLAVQSIALADKLSRLGVPIETLFYPPEYTPQLEHEYQFNLDLADGRQALALMLTFLEKAFK